MECSCTSHIQYFAVDGMPIEMYGESWIAGLLTCDDVILYMAGFETMHGIERYLLRIHGMNYTEVINASSAANSTRIDYSHTKFAVCTMLDLLHRHITFTYTCRSHQDIMHLMTSVHLIMRFFVYIMVSFRVRGGAFAPTR